jgi:hypothetical protein
MASITCPFCGNTITFHRFILSTNKPFCPNCGWNADRARKDLASKGKNLKLVAAIAVIVTIAVIIGLVRGNEFFSLFPLALLAIVLTSAYWWDFMGTKREMDDVLSPSKTNPVESDSSPVPSPFLQKVLSMTRPRRVVLRPVGRFSALIFAFLLFVTGSLGLFAAESIVPGEFRWKEILPLFPLFAILVILVTAISFTMAREQKKRSIIRDGEVAAARVISQRVVARGKQSYNQITYEFAPPSGPLIRKTERDHTKLIFEDMLIPVFFEAGSPSACFSLTSTYYRLPDAEI